MASSKGKEEAKEIASPESSRLKGNDFFRKSKQPGLAPIVRKSHLQHAIRCYREALNDADAEEEISSNYKNIGVAHYYMALCPLPTGNEFVENIPESDRRELIWCCKEGADAFTQAAQVGKARDSSWLDGLTRQYDSLLQQLSERFRNLAWPSRLSLYAAIGEGMRFIPREKQLAEPARKFFLRHVQTLHMYSITLVDQANAVFRKAPEIIIIDDDEDDEAFEREKAKLAAEARNSRLSPEEKKAKSMSIYARCLALLGDSHGPLELSRPPPSDPSIPDAFKQIIASSGSVIDLSGIDDEWEEVQENILTQIAICESSLKRMTADQMLARTLAEAEEVNPELVWTVVDMLTESIVLARDRDLEGVLIAYSRIGALYEKFLMNKSIAYNFHLRVVTGAISLQPRIVTAEEWYIASSQFVEEERRRRIRREDEEVQKERLPFLNAMKKELDELRKKSEMGSSVLLKHVYSKHPPKNPAHVMGSLDGEELKKSLQKAITHYHPDKAPADDRNWKVLCEEITKYLTSAYSRFKGF